MWNLPMHMESVHPSASFCKTGCSRHAFEEGEFEKEAEAVCDYQSAVKMAVSHMTVDTDVRNVLIAHQFVTGACAVSQRKCP